MKHAQQGGEAPAAAAEALQKAQREVEEYEALTMAAAWLDAATAAGAAAWAAAWDVVWEA